ncbi:hypothetical protein HZA97_03855 [Candidatus Woesearchaeota archaeon]|nr:hypothetical protein [Candidatus Woesearchaeota archaeon]
MDAELEKHLIEEEFPEGTQTELMDLFNKSGKIMASMPDFYDVAKYGDENTLRTIKKELENDKKIVSSTRINYEPEGLECEITHYFNIKSITPTIKKVKIPELRRYQIYKMYAEHLDMQNFLQALFDTEDNVETIKKNLEKLIGEEAHKIQLWTLPENGRDLTDYDKSSAGFFKDIDDQYVIYGDVPHLNKDFAGIAFSLDQIRGNSKDNQSELPETNNGLFCNLTSKIDKKLCCVYFTNLDQLESFSKYSGLFCFHNKRFVVSLTLPLGDQEHIDEDVSKILAGESSSEEKVKELNSKFSPLYSHLSKYFGSDKNYELIDDIEAFGKPTVEVKK